MINKPFFGLGKPKLKYPVVEGIKQGVLKEIPLSPDITILMKKSDVNNSEKLTLKVGDRVRTGQKLMPLVASEDYLISTATGTIAGISEYIGYLGRAYISISINAAEQDQWDNEFGKGDKSPDRETAHQFLNRLPGNTEFSSFLNPQPPVDTIIINGMDKDPLITTNQLVLDTEIEGLIEGIENLKKISGVNRVIIVVPPHLAIQAGKAGAEAKVISPAYPNTLPEMIIKKVLGKEVPPGKSCEEIGIGFINAETVVALANAFNSGNIPVNKRLTVIKKDYSTVNIKTRIGTSVKDILNNLDIKTEHGDQIVFGGPMTGIAVYSEEMPVTYDTDAIMIQGKEQITHSSDSQCINCGECIRICPAKVPVNMLVRLLENGLYEEAVEQYDLLSCIECGLCSYVCIAKIPVFHYIMLGKHELVQIMNAEETNA